MASNQEREAQRTYWKEHSSNATVETMMLDSQASDIDKLERPEVRIEMSRCEVLGPTPLYLQWLPARRPP